MQNIRLGELEVKALFALEERETRVITLSELAKTLRLSRIQAWNLTSQLVKKKRLIRIKRGIYLFAPMKSGPRGLWTENALAAVPVLMNGKEYYVGFWAAISHYMLTEQIPLTVQIVSASRQHAFRALQTRFEFFQVRQLGEWQEEEINGLKVRFATIEQLIIDCLGYPENCGGMKETCKALWEARDRIDWKKLDTLASKSNDAVQRRLGYLTELLKLHRMKAKRFVGWRWLDPTANKVTKTKSKKWGLVLNISDKTLTQWKEA